MSLMGDPSTFCSTAGDLWTVYVCFPFYSLPWGLQTGRETTRRRTGMDNEKHFCTVLCPQGSVPFLFM